MSEPELIKFRDSGSWRRWVGEQMLAAAKSGQWLTHYETRLDIWNFGDDLTMVSLPGEVTVGYVRLIEEAIGPRDLWINAYCNDVFGYLTTGKIIEEGGYETRGLYSGGIGFFSSKAEGVLVNQVKSMAVDAGRDVEKHR